MKRIRTVAVALAVLLAALLALAAAASAHVTVTAPGATSGGSDQEITFRVPVEKDADTVGLKLALPTDTPIASVLVEPTPGWTHTEKTTTLKKPIVTDDGSITAAVTEIDWTAQHGQGLKPGEFGSFTIIAGQLPDASSLTFKAIQVYSDGSQVAWTQTEAPGSTAELDNPAPVLTLAPKGSGSGSGSSASPAPASSAQPGTSNQPAGSTVVKTKAASNTGAIVLSIVALVVAAGALGFAVVTRAKGRMD